MIQYEYLCHQRPPMPGAVPRDGLVAVRNPPDGVDNVNIDGVTYNCWGYVTYNRSLSDREMSDYELKFVATRHVYN